jgi:hypothetical protein
VPEKAFADSEFKSSIFKPVEELLSWQIPALSDVAAILPGVSPGGIERSSDPRGWVQGAMLIGMAHWALVSKNESLWQWLEVRAQALAVRARCRLKTFCLTAASFSKATAWPLSGRSARSRHISDSMVLSMQARAEAQEYKLGDRLYHADDHAVGQLYYALHAHRAVPFEKALGPTKATLDFILENPVDVELEFGVKGVRARLLARFSGAAARSSVRCPVKAAARGSSSGKQLGDAAMSHAPSTRQSRHPRRSSICTAQLNFHFDHAANLLTRSRTLAPAHPRVGHGRPWSHAC